MERQEDRKRRMEKTDGEIEGETDGETDGEREPDRERVVQRGGGI